MRTPFTGAVLLLLAAACGTLRDGRRWGQDATIAPGGERLMQAVHDAAVDPWTWMPLAGVGVLMVGSNWDEHLADWASEETPVFGSMQDADDAGHTLRGIAQKAWVISMIATPSGDEAGPWIQDKVQGFAVELSATVVNSQLTSSLKDTFNRERPSGAQDGFPSSGASDTFTFTTLAKRNVEAMGLRPGTRTMLQAGLSAVSVAEAWSRVESGEHFPTDVLVGAALGNFVARVVHDGFLGLSDDVWVTAYFDPGGDGFSIGVTYSF